ncbi:MAG: hypothetical protein M0P59_03255 [Gallionella sp.]|jgi:hypothetical protein|nr:hypothetical protein [Gallionella sp.]MCK9353156.1 hypothetical protein [Gallionella sp.]
MKKQLAIALFLTASVNAYAVDGGAVVGGAIGGAAGAAVGYNVGGQNGAILGAAIGGATGAAVGSRNTPAPVVQAAPATVVPVRTARADDEEHGHYDNGKHRGHDKHHHDKKD